MKEKQGNLTIKDIARICGVGISTVSRAINDDPRIRPETKEKVLRVIKDTHYIPNNSARNLKMTESNTIALLLKGIDNQFFQLFIEVFEDECLTRGYSFFLYAVRPNQRVEDVAAEVTKERRLKGIIILGGEIDFPTKSLDALHVPYVLCTVAAVIDARRWNCDSVAIDDVKESYRAVDYLIQKGHRRIAMIAGLPDDRTVGAKRLEGYRQALAAHHIPADPVLVRHMDPEYPEYTSRNGYEVTKQLLRENVEFTAIFAISDVVAQGVYRAVFEAGKRIPDDYSIVGFDGLEFTDYMWPALTTVRQPADEMAKKSIELLMKAIDGETDREQFVYEAELVEKESVREI